MAYTQYERHNFKPARLAMIRIGDEKDLGESRG